MRILMPVTRNCTLPFSLPPNAPRCGRRIVQLSRLSMRSRDSAVYTPVSLGPDTDDEETLVNEEVYKNGEL